MEVILALSAVLIIFVAVGILGARNPILLKMGLRNLVRRRTQTVIVISGLLIGTTIISSSLVIGDSLEYIFVKDTLDRLDAIDELVHNQTLGQGEYRTFDIRFFTELENSLETTDTPVDGIAPLLVKTVSVRNVDEDLGEGGMSLIGFNASHEGGFGTFKSVEGENVNEYLSGDEAIINERTAEKLNAKMGQNLTIIFGNFSNSHNLSVKYIVENDGRGNWQKGSNIFINLETAQSLFNESGKINQIKISNTGDREEGVSHSGVVSDEIESIIDANGWQLVVEEKKRDDIDRAKEFSENVTEIFMVLGSFSIIAGVLLIINIFVMLAEERKSTMGISRAVGMKRGHLMQTYIFEGLFYSVLAAILGTFFGLLLGYIIVYSFGVIFADVAEGLLLSFHFEWMSLFLAFCLGLIITFVTIAVASWKVSKLNIVRAIRNIPEPVMEKASKKTVFLGIFMVVTGALLLFKAFEEGTSLNTWIFAGPGLIILGVSFLLHRIVKARTAFTIGGIALITWILFPRGEAEGAPADIQMFIVIGVLLVLGAVLIVMFNSEQILKPFFVLGSKKKGKPVLTIATSYPMRKRFRTGMTLAIFALTIFTVTVISMMSHLQEGSVIEEVERQTGGFDIIGRTLSPQKLNLTDEIEKSQTLDSDDFEFHSSAAIVQVNVKKERQQDDVEYFLWGFEDKLLDGNSYTFEERANNYSDDTGFHSIDSDRDVWEALKMNSSLAVVDGSTTLSYYSETFGSSLTVELGDILMVTDTLGNNANLTVIGIMDQSLVQTWGIFTSGELVEDSFPVKTYAYFFRVMADVDGFEVSQNIEKTFFAWSMDAVYLPDIVQTVLDIQRSVMLLLQSYLGLGLLVGIAAMGIITIRSVVERKQEIGTLRAIGFKSRMISRAFLLEISFVSILGITLGIVLGLALSYDMYIVYYASRVSFSIPWFNILFIAAIAYIATLIATSSPARRAAKIPPAEAVRYIE
jgi:putative ABC transport system permease protein